MLTKNLRVFGHKIPLYPLFMVSGAICDVFQALIDYLISKVYTYEWGRTTVCWTLSYTLSIILRHSSHRLLVFGDYDGTYCMSLTRTYMAYSTAIVFSMFTNHQLVELGLEHREAWVITMLVTGVYNFFVLKSSWRVINKATGRAEEALPSKVQHRDRTTSSDVVTSTRERTSSSGGGTILEKDITPNRKRSTSMRIEGSKQMTFVEPKVRRESLKDSNADLAGAV